MRKILMICVAAALCASAAAPAFAGTLSDSGASETVDVKGTFVANKAPKVYSVDVAWGDMGFTYTEKNDGAWNPATHEYTNTVAANWKNEVGANEVKVTNHSNADVKATFAYAAEAAYKAVSGSFTYATLSLSSAVGTEVSKAPSGTTQLSLTGDLPESAGNDGNTVIGKVTVTLDLS